ncbi:hypothetical protein ILUMI_18149 [Ignelater luminosus]|uniref:Uncharacterized protein n=1 Tax=Ignelater luminosus TaxID=2038154 RepID=A0A8K0CIK3_IGNLU|nr:hypothetical protein ILUMI_18149 [Ignelater luminosus]
MWVIPGACKRKSQALCIEYRDDDAPDDPRVSSSTLQAVRATPAQDNLRFRSPSVANPLMARSASGRPRLEEQQPELLKTIVDLTMFGVSAKERRCSEIVRSCQTLTDLHDKLKEHGFEISKSSTYLRLLPRNYSTLEGKRHVAMVPVKLSRLEADHHKAHFCVATIRCLETVASILGPDQVFFLSQNDKARVPIGLTAANKQAPLLMHVEYRCIRWVHYKGQRYGPLKQRRTQGQRTWLLEAPNILHRQLIARPENGLILPHDFHGTHLDKEGRTTDFDLEKENFQKAREVLVEVWNCGRVRAA